MIQRSEKSDDKSDSILEMETCFESGGIGKLELYKMYTQSEEI
jgi:hypothetical protein